MGWTSRTDALRFDCPCCAAPVSQKCVGARGKKRESVHRERMSLAASRLGHPAVRTVQLDGNQLVADDGTVIGRLTGVEIDVQSEWWGTYGGEGSEMGSSASLTQTEDSSPEGAGRQQSLTGEAEQLFDAPEPVKQVWEHYQRTVKGAGRRKLDSTRRTIIRNALKARPVEACCKAIDGLARSAWHNGQNESGTEYLDIRYALKGNSQRGEANDERIDRMAAKADGEPANERTTVSAALARVPSDRRWIIEGHMSDVRRAAERGERDEKAERVVREQVGLEPVFSDGQLSGWRTAT